MPLEYTFGGRDSAPLSKISGPLGLEFVGSELPSSVVAFTRLGNASVGKMLKTLLLKPGSVVGILKVIVVLGWS